MSWKTAISVTWLASSIGWASPGCPETASARRAEYSYPLTLKGPAALVGQRIAYLNGYAHKGGAFERVPIQIDEVNANGDYVLDGGLPFTKATDDGWFDENDELAVAGASLGDDFVEATLPKELVAQSGDMWKLAFCRKGAYLGTLLVVASAAPPPPSPPRARFDSGEGAIDTDLYSYTFNKKHPALLGEVSLKHENTKRPLIESSRFLMPMATPFFMPDMTFDHSDFTSAIESWQVGPVRTIVAVGVKYAAFLSLFKLHLFSELVFYENRFEIPTVIEFIFDPSSVLRPGSGLAYAIKFPAGGGFETESNLAPLPDADPKDVITKGPRASEQEIYFARAKRQDGSFLIKARVDQKARAKVPPPFLARAGDFRRPELAKRWDFLPALGEGGADLGIFMDISQIGAGTYDFGLDLVLSPKANDQFTDYGSVDAHWLQMVARPKN